MGRRADFETIFRKKSYADVLATIRRTKDLRGRDRDGWTLSGWLRTTGTSTRAGILSTQAPISRPKRRAENSAARGSCGDQCDNALSLWRARCATFLLERGASVSVADEHGETPLHCALTVGRTFPDLVDALLGRGADVRARTCTGRTPIHAAAEDGDARNIKLLLHRGAKRDEVDDDGRGVLAFAVGSLTFGDADTVAKKCDLVLSLLESGLSREAYERTDGPLLVAAAYHRSLPLVEYCLAHGADVDTPNAAGRTALLAAASVGDAAIVERLLRAGADPLAKPPPGRAPLHWLPGTATSCRFSGAPA